MQTDCTNPGRIRRTSFVDAFVIASPLLFDPDLFVNTLEFALIFEQSCGQSLSKQSPMCQHTHFCPTYPPCANTVAEATSSPSAVRAPPLGLYTCLSAPFPQIPIRLSPSPLFHSAPPEIPVSQAWCYPPRLIAYMARGTAIQLAWDPGQGDERPEEGVLPASVGVKEVHTGSCSAREQRSCRCRVSGEVPNRSYGKLRKNKARWSLLALNAEPRLD